MIFNKIRILFFCFIGLLLATPTSVFAGAESGFYLGAGIGDASLEATNFDQSDSATKIFGGYNIGLVPFLDVAIEASYVDFGKPNTVIGSTPVSYELTGLNAFGLVGLSFGPFGFFAKAGLINWDSDSVIGTTKSSDSGTDAAYGIGARFQISSLALRAEYEVYDISSSSVTDLAMFSISGVFTF